METGTMRIYYQNSDLQKKKLCTDGEKTQLSFSPCSTPFDTVASSLTSERDL